MLIDPRAAELRDRLRGMLVAAAATPMDQTGEIDRAAVDSYLGGLVADGADALAVLAHTGRGPHLPPPARAQVIHSAVATGVPVLVGVGGGTEDAASRQAQAAQAAALGADGLLVFPSPAGSDSVAEHDRIWSAAGLPLVAFDLYLRPYSLGTLAAVLAHPGVAALKVARLTDAIACQEALAMARDAGRLPITGEDRMFGPSLLWGAQAALVGLAAAAVSVTASVIRSFTTRRYGDFVAASTRLDALAEVTFTKPYEGYVQRMLWIAVAEGRVPGSAAYDPFGPILPPSDRLHVLRRCTELGLLADCPDCA